MSAAVSGLIVNLHLEVQQLLRRAEIAEEKLRVLQANLGSRWGSPPDAGVIAQHAQDVAAALGLWSQPLEPINA